MPLRLMGWDRGGCGTADRLHPDATRAAADAAEFVARTQISASALFNPAGKTLDCAFRVEKE